MEKLGSAWSFVEPRRQPDPPSKAAVIQSEALNEHATPTSADAAVKSLTGIKAAHDNIKPNVEASRHGVGDQVRSTRPDLAADPLLREVG